MLKIGIIGLGDIATKAYLPVLGRKDLEIHLFTRNEEKLHVLSAQYRIRHLHPNLESILNSGINAAFVHTATPSHEAIVTQLLDRNIHVYVDKPVTSDFTSTSKLVHLAREKQRILMAGFNRRFAPAYERLAGLRNVNMILMQKNRRALPGEVRTFVFDDFIHVVDTLLFLCPGPPERIAVTGKKSGGLLHHAVVQFQYPDGLTAMGIMNRDSGTVEERLEVFTSAEKWIVNNVTDTVVLRDSHATHYRVGDWESTLYKRGFEQITDTFLKWVGAETQPAHAYDDILLTHQICEQVVKSI